MDLLCSAFPESDIGVAPVGSLQGRLSWLLSREDSDLISLLISEGKVPSFDQFYPSLLYRSNKLYFVYYNAKYHYINFIQTTKLS